MKEIIIKLDMPEELKEDIKEFGDPSVLIKKLLQKELKKCKN